MVKMALKSRESVILTFLKELTIIHQLRTHGWIYKITNYSIDLKTLANLSHWDLFHKTM